MNRFFQVFLFFCCSISTYAACAGNCPNLDAVNNPECFLRKAAVGNDLDGTNNFEEVKRTSNSLFSFPFVHDGNTGTFTISAQGDGDDTGLGVAQGPECEGKAAIAFSSAGRKSVRVEVTQILTSISLTSSNAAVVVYDNVAPEISLQTVSIGDTEEGVPGEPFSAGKTYFVSEGTLTFNGRVNDPAPSQDPDLMGVRILSGPDLGQDFFPVTEETNGSFSAGLNMTNVEDGEFTLQLAGIDTNQPTFQFEDGSEANTGDPVAVKVVKDSTPPVLTKVEIVSGTGENQNTQETPNVFVQGGREISIRATFSEELSEAPVLLLEHQGPDGGADTEPYAAPLNNALFEANPTQAVYRVTPLFDVNNLGGVNFSFGDSSGTGAGGGSKGFDRARNPLDLSQGVGDNGIINRAIVVDGQGPNLVRLPQDQEAQSGLVRTEPANNEILARDEFPDSIKIFVDDYNIPESAPDFQDDEAILLATNNGSGVDFDKVAQGSDAEQDRIRVTVTGPEENEVRGTLLTQSPNSLIYDLPSVAQLFPPTGTPVEGNYTVQVELVDKVGNTSAEAFTFSVDTEPVNPGSIQVKLVPEQGDGTDGAGGVNLSLREPIEGKEIPDSPGQVDLATLDSVNQIDSFDLCSTDPAFDVTASEVALKARLNGPDTIAREMVTACAPQDAEENICGSTGLIRCTINKELANTVFPNLDFSFPNPESIGQHVNPGDRDPRFGQYDGPYQVEVIARDTPGNVSDPIVKEFLLDTTPPFTEMTFPKRFAKINTPLRHVSAVVVDPSPPRLHTFEQDGKVNFGSGISIRSSKMTLKLQNPYKNQEDLDSSVFDPGDGNEVRGSLDFIHNPNSFDPTVPTFNPNDDAYRVLLEFTDAGADTITLPVDGSADGIYSMGVIPVDNAGNAHFDGSNGGPNNGGYQAPSEGGEKPQELVRNFLFLLDTVPPSVKLTPLPGQTSEPNQISVNGNTFRMSGKVRDLSARPNQNALRGGAGMDRVEYSLVLMTINGEMPEGQEDTISEGGVDIGIFKSNPILKDQTATLSPLLDPSNDPHVSSTRPMDPQSYPNIQMEEREFQIQGTLPAFNRILEPDDVGETNSSSNYVLIIKAYDLAGNITERRLIVNLNQSSLAGPELVFPGRDAAVKSPAVKFEWKPLQDAADYVLTLSNPDLQTTTYSVVKSDDNPNVLWNLVLSKQGRYEWKVQGRDAVGNLGLESQKHVFYYDNNPPEVQSITWSDLSPDAKSRLGIGTFRLQVTFNEDLKSGPEVYFDPLSSSVPRQLIETAKLNGPRWEGVATIPTTATQEWDGKATLEIGQARDMAENLMQTDRNYEFAIDTGPSYSVRYFENPVYQQEITLVVKSTEPLLNAPVLTELQQVSAPQSSMFRINDEVYGVPLKITASQSGTANVRISASDLDGNAASRIVTFPVEVMSSQNGGTVTASLLKVQYTTQTVSQNTALAILPRPEARSPSEKSILASMGQVASQTEPELELIQELELMVPTGRALSQARAEVHLSSALKEKQGLFLKSQGRHYLLEGQLKENWMSVNLPETGQLGIYRDAKPPVLELKAELESEGIESENPRIEFVARDLGSGIRQEKMQVLLSGQELAFESQEEDQFVYRFDGHAVRGENALKISVSDRLGNSSILKSVLQVLGPIQIKAISYPNPARTFSTFRYDLSRSASDVQIKIYDAAGSLIFNTSSNRDAMVTANRGLNTWRWDLVNRRGGFVANGVYFASIEARDSEGNLDRQRLKIAVLQ